MEQQLSKPKLLDTDLVTLQIWSQEKYSIVSRLISKEVSQYDKSRFYFLCKPDLPWEPDPMRENPEDRDRLFEVYEEFLKSHGLNYAIICGSRATRINKVKEILLVRL